MPSKFGTQWRPLTCMVTTPSSSAASLRIWLASTCASSRMEKSASATAPKSQHATTQNSQRDGRCAPAPARPGEPGQRRARAAAPAVSSSSGSRTMLPLPTPRRWAPGAGKRGGSHGRCAQGPLGAPRKTFFPLCRRLSAPQRLPNLGGARLQRGSAGGHHRRAPAVHGRGSGRRSGSRDPGADAAPAARRASRGAAVPAPGCAGRAAAGLTVGQRAGWPPSLPFPESLFRRQRRLGRAAAPSGGGAATRLLGWDNHPSEERDGEIGRKKKKKLKERKQAVERGKGRCLVPPRCAPAPRTSRLGRRRGCGDLWNQRERRGNSPSRPSSLSLVPAPEPVPGDA